MIDIFFIRHGATEGNLRRRYIGRTDEPLCEAGIAQVKALQKRGLSVDEVFVSPLLRTRQTADILFPKMHYTVVDGLIETDFGRFEGKSADKLSGDPAYQAWDSSSTAASSWRSWRPMRVRRRTFMPTTSETANACKACMTEKQFRSNSEHRPHSGYLSGTRTVSLYGIGVVTPSARRRPCRARSTGCGWSSVRRPRKGTN